MMESKIERYFGAKITEKRGLFIKFTSPTMAGLPDRLLLLPGGKVIFIEFKAPGEVMRPQQLVRKKKLESLGFEVYCIESKETADIILERIFNK